MLPIIGNFVVFKVFYQAPQHYVFQQLTADASKGYRSVIWRPVLSPFLKHWGNVCLPPIFRNYSRFYHDFSNLVTPGTVMLKFCMGPKGLCRISGKSLVIFSLNTDLNCSFSTFAFPLNQKLICHPLWMVQRQRSPVFRLGFRRGMAPPIFRGTSSWTPGTQLGVSTL